MNFHLFSFTDTGVETAYFSVTAPVKRSISSGCSYSWANLALNSGVWSGIEEKLYTLGSAQNALQSLYPGRPTELKPLNNLLRRPGADILGSWGVEAVDV